MKKSNLSLNKTIARKDLINSFTVLSALLIIIYGILMYLFTLSPETSENGVITSSIEASLFSLSMQRYIFCYETGSAVLLTVLGGLALGLIQFEFLHRKKYCSSLFSFSVSRKRLYFNRLILPLVLMIICSLIPHFIALKINIDAFGVSTTMLSWFLIHILTFVQILTTTYAISVTACMFTGRTIEAAAGAISIASIPSAIWYVTENLFERLLFGYFDSSILVNFDPTYLCVAIFCSQITGHYAINTPISSTYIWHLVCSMVWIILSIVLMLSLAPYFSKKYKPENSGFKGINKGMVFIISFTIPFYLTALFAEILETYLYPNISLNSNLSIVILSALISFAISIVCGILIHFTHKKLKISLISGATLAGSIAVITILSLTGIFGAYNKIPDTSEIEKIEVEAPFSEFFPDLDLYTDFSMQLVYNSTTALLINEKEDIEIVRNLHEKASERCENATASKLCLTYTLKDGSKITRDYRYLSEEVTEEIIKLWDTQAAKEMYKRCLFPKYEGVEALDSDPDYTLGYYEQPHIMNYTDEEAVLKITAKDGTEHSILDEVSERDFIRLKNAIYKDICELNSSEWFTPEKPQIGKISFSNANYQQFSGRKILVDFYINENMKNTIKALKEINLYKYFENKKDIEGVLVADIRDYVYWHGGMLFDENARTIHQPYFISDIDGYCWSLYGTPFDDYEQPPVKEITDKLEIKSLTEKGYIAYNILNNGRIVFVKYTDETYSSYVIPYEK